MEGQTNDEWKDKLRTNGSRERKRKYEWWWWFL